MSKSSIPQNVRYSIWARAAGRCQYPGCNAPLVGDLLAGREDGTFGFIAHIVADRKDGPRGDPVRSPLLATELANLMLLCGTHHRLIDEVDLQGHPVDVLLEMKRQHEERISIVTDMDEDRASHVLRFGADIGKNEALVSTKAIFASMPPANYPADGRTLDLELLGCSYRDHEPEYWVFQRDNLRRKFEEKVKGRVERQEIRHLSVFALAPQPLLIELGRLLGDIMPVSVRQRHREPPTWKWQDAQPEIEFEIGAHAGGDHRCVALKLAISATIVDDRIRAVLSPDVPIWSIGARNPGNDVLRRPEDQSQYRKHLRHLLNALKAAHPNAESICVFPALPASLAIETGRVWMPKADLPLKIFDQNASAGGFIPTLELR